MLVKRHHYYVKVTSSCDVASPHNQELPDVYFRIIMQKLNGEQEKESIICVRADRKNPTLELIE